MERRVLRSLGEVPAGAWDTLAGDAQPFVRHAFLHGLETTGSIRRELGWQPHHVTLWQGEELVAAAPCWLKRNSHGEFVFDHAWAELYERVGRAYYPKLLCAVPYSPVAGPRLLVGDGGAPMRARLAGALEDAARDAGCSGVHVNFAEDDDAAALGEAGWFERPDCQYHWDNHGYADFDAFLAVLTSRRRKEVRRERASFAGGSWRFDWLDGDALRESGHLDFVYRCYARTFVDKGNYPALTAAFFHHLAASLPAAIQACIATRDGQPIAMAFGLRGRDTLFGRYWGAEEFVPALHFEACYYQGIARSIELGLARFEPGAQGEHKVSRGFQPVRTRSLHRLLEPRIERVIRQAVAGEAAWLARYERSLLAHSPYAQRESGAEPPAG